MHLDLWKFNEQTLKKSTEQLPNSILKEQADMLSVKTGGVIYGKITNIKFTPQDKAIPYNLATLFDIVVPNLDNYHYTLLNLYSRPECDFPIAITVDSNLIDDAEVFSPDFVCRDREEFIEALRKILSSDEVSKNIEILYSKASF